MPVPEWFFFLETPMMPYRDWKRSTTSGLTRRGNLTVRREVDVFLQGYQWGNIQVGDWTTRVHPLIKIIQKINVWMGDRYGTNSFLKVPLDRLWEMATAELRMLMADVQQGYFLTVRGWDNPRFLCTTGALACMVVILYDKETHTATLGHLFARMMIDRNGDQTAAQSVQSMIESFNPQNENMDNVIAYVIGGRPYSDRPQGENGPSKRDLLIEALTDNGVTDINFEHTLLPEDVILNVAFDCVSGQLSLFQPKYDTVTKLGLRRHGIVSSEGSELLALPPDNGNGLPQKPWV